MRKRFKTTISSINDGIWVQKHGELNYCFGAFLGIQISFNLIFYNCYLDERIKIYNSLKL